MNIKKTKLITVLYLVAILGFLSLIAYNSFFDTRMNSLSSAEIASLNTQSDAEVSESSSTMPADLPIFSQVLQSKASGSNETFSNTASEILSRLFFAAFLSLLLAFRPRKTIPLFQRNFHVIQTQILLAVVAASLMMIVGDNAARAFAIFAAVSLVRFRTNIKNPKEITVLLVSLAIGLAAGVGYWQLGAVLCFFTMGTLWFLEVNEDEKSFRTMELCIKTGDVYKTKLLLKDTFEKHNLENELRRIDLREKDSGKITYLLTIPLGLKTDTLTQQIIYSDTDNICDVEWSHKRKELQIYE